jgi:hypothetical protein
MERYNGSVCQGLTIHRSLHDAKNYGHRKHRRTQKEFLKKAFLLYRFLFRENLCHSVADKIEINPLHLVALYWR